MRSWTRTLNLGDAHTLLAMSLPGTPEPEWTARASRALAHQSPPRRRELVRMVRESFLDWQDEAVAPGLFLTHYLAAGAMGQVELAEVQWALTHPLPLVAVAELVEPALASDDPEVPLDRVDAFVAGKLTTRSAASLRKTRTVLIGALADVGALDTSGTGQHRALRARRGCPGAEARAYLIARGGPDLPRRLTACAPVTPGPTR